MNDALKIIGILKEKKVDLGRKLKLNNSLGWNKIKGAFPEESKDLERLQLQDTDYFYNYIPLESPMHILSSISAENYFSQDIKSIENILKIMQETYTNIEHGSADTDSNLFSLELKDENIEQYLKLISFFSSQESPFCLNNDFFSKIERTNGKKEGLLGAELRQIEQNLNIRIRHSW